RSVVYLLVIKFAHGPEIVVEFVNSCVKMIEIHRFSLHQIFHSTGVPDDRPEDKYNSSAVVDIIPEAYKIQVIEQYFLPLLNEFLIAHFLLFVQIIGKEDRRDEPGDFRVRHEISVFDVWQSGAPLDESFLL